MSLLASLFINLAVFVAVAIGGGLGSAWYMIEAGSRLTTRTFGPWVTWTSAGRADADPYTRARIARNALLPVASTLELTYQAKSDSAGGRLYPSCDYAVVMDGFDPAWWSLAAFDSQGRLIQNPAERYGFNSDTVMREPDGRVVITLSRDARPRNWLPIGRGSRVTLLLTVQDAAWAAAVYDGNSTAPLPQIQKLACR